MPIDKPRFNYTWDWTSRLVQIGISDKLFLESGDDLYLDEIVVQAGYDWQEQRGKLRLRGRVHGPVGPLHKIRIILENAAGKVLEAYAYDPEEFDNGVEWQKLEVVLWNLHGHGPQTLYNVRVQLVERGRTIDEQLRQVGFKQVEWRPCDGAPEGADPWICVVNDFPLFLQGVNWTPIRPNFADVADDEYRRRLEVYQELGCNVLRVWGGAFLEKEIFYNLCDEMGILVWQELPLSSSGLDNWPPEDEASICTMETIAQSYVERRSHHPSLLMWCGGNELQGGLDGSKTGVGKPIDKNHPMMQRVEKVLSERDPWHRFVPASSSGPRFMADSAEFGQGLHWDVHGPWNVTSSWEDYENYWQRDDSLLRSETGCPGASGADIIERYAGGLPTLPATLDNPLWRRTSWWIDWAELVEEFGREPQNLEEYCAWSQERQKRALVIAARECKKRFPACGGFIVWMGHDSFPCTSNTSILDFHGRPKPAALGLGQVFQTSPENLRDEIE
jgi:beta-mannosidase